MSLEGLPEQNPELQPPVWQEEFFYFGNANWPSDATYRTSGERVQKRAEKALHVSKDADGKLTASTEGVAEFLSEFEECEFLLLAGHDIHEAHGGGRTDPSIYMIGWYELETQEELEHYAEDKKYGSKSE